MPVCYRPSPCASGLTRSGSRPARPTRIAFLHEGRDPRRGLRPRCGLALRCAGGARRGLPGEGDGGRRSRGAAGCSAASVRRRRPPARLRAALRRALGTPCKARRPSPASCFDAAVSPRTPSRALLPHVALGDYSLRPLQVEAAASAKPRRAGGRRRPAARVSSAQAFAGAAAARRRAWPRRSPGPATSATPRATTSARPSSRARPKALAASGTGCGCASSTSARSRRRRWGACSASTPGAPVRRCSSSASTLRAKPRGTAVLVGKGITFDSGGISLKPAAVDGRDEVRHDGRGDRLRLPRGGEGPRRSRSGSSRSPP